MGKSSYFILFSSIVKVKTIQIVQMDINNLN